MAISSNPTPVSAGEAQNGSVNGAKKDPPIYEQFRAGKNQSKPFPRFRNTFNDCCFRLWNRNSDNGASENNAKADPDANASDSKNRSENIFGFDYEVLWLVRLLVKPAEKEEEDFKRIGIVGMPDVGKSDIGRLIFSNESVKQHFAPRIWVPMSGKSTKSVVIDILKQLDVTQQLIDQWINGGAATQAANGADREAANGASGGAGIKTGTLADSGAGSLAVGEAASGADREAVDALLYALNLKLIGKRYLIILDDVYEWKNNEGSVCDPFEFGFPKGSGGAVVVTSRKKSVVKEKVENVYFPQPIKNADSCWDIYNTVLDERKIEHPTEELKNEFKKKIGGLPVAARLMGEIKMKKLGTGSDGKSNNLGQNGDGNGKNLGQNGNT